MSSLTNYHAGLAAEDSVARAYLCRGYSEAHRRWRGAGGELDLIMRNGDEIVVVEVKKSETHARAAHRLQPRQLSRICMSAAEFVEGEPMGQLTDLRIDLALVDSAGVVKIVENVTLQ